MSAHRDHRDDCAIWMRDPFYEDSWELGDESLCDCECPCCECALRNGWYELTDLNAAIYNFRAVREWRRLREELNAAA